MATIIYSSTAIAEESRRFIRVITDTENGLEYMLDLDSVTGGTETVYYTQQVQVGPYTETLDVEGGCNTRSYAILRFEQRRGDTITHIENRRMALLPVETGSISWHVMQAACNELRR